MVGGFKAVVEDSRTLSHVAYAVHSHPAHLEYCKMGNIFRVVIMML